MRFGLLYHHQLPRPWDEGAEERLLNESLEQIELADRLGFDCAWMTEHHFLDEYSHASAPEVFLAAAAARTKKIRLAHGIVSLPSSVNHPARVAERISTLDLISGGRVEFGTGQGSTELELQAFGVDRATKRDQWEEALGVIVRMLTDVPFTGHQGKWVDVPPRNVLPKPKQKPHPPLWVACSSPETIEHAGRNGLGALTLAFTSIEETRDWVQRYYRALESEDCVPAGRAVNANMAVVMPMLCHENEDVALDRGLEGAHYFGYAFMHYYIMGQHRPGTTELWAEFEENRELFGFVRNPEDGPEGMDEQIQARIDALRKGIGTPARVGDAVRALEDAGVDQVVFQVQTGRTKHEHICESLELFAKEVMPEFADRREARDSAKAERLAEPIGRALTRIPSDTNDISDYVVDIGLQLGPQAPEDED